MNTPIHPKELERKDYSNQQLNPLEDSSRKPTKTQISLFGIIIVIFLILSINAFDSFQLGVWMDDALYTRLAQSLIYTDHYGLYNIMTNQYDAPQYPFGFPLLLSPFVLLFPNNMDVLKIPSLLATLLNAALLFWGWRWFSNRSYWWGVALVGLYLLSPLTVNHSRMVMSEAVFTTFCLTAMILAEKAVQGKQTRGWHLFMCVSLVFVLFTRTVGLIMVASIFLYILFRKGKHCWKSLVLIIFQMSFLTGMILILTPVGWDGLIPLRYLSGISLPFDIDLRTYTDENKLVPTSIPFDNGINISNNKQIDLNNSAIPQQLINNDQDEKSPLKIFIERCILYLPESLRQTVLPIGGGTQEQFFATRIGLPGLPRFLEYFTFGLVAIGYYRWLRKQSVSVFCFFSIFYIGTLLFWWVDSRMLYPIQPQLSFGLLLGIETLLTLGGRLRKWGFFRNRGDIIIVSVVFFLFFISSYTSFQIDDSRLHTGDLTNRTHWIKSNTDSTDIIMTEYPNVDYLYSKRKTIPFSHSFSSADELQTFLIKYQVDYVLVAPSNYWQYVYNPVYSRPTKHLLPYLNTLTFDGQISLEYSSEQDMIKVYKMKFPK